MTRYTASSGRALMVGALIGLLTSLWATPANADAEAAPAPAPAVPELSINIDNGRTSTEAGETLNYVITVQNLGTADADGLQISQTVPDGLVFASADASGTHDTGRVSWTLDVKATETATLHTSMTVVATPHDLLRLASVVCAGQSVDGPAIVCATHSDLLPAGAAAITAEAAMNPTVSPASSGQPWWYLPAGLIATLALAVLIVVSVLWRRKRHATEVPTPT